PRLPVKKLRKQLKLLLLLALLTSAAWFTYLHISLVRQGRALRLPFAYGKDGERPGEVTDPGRRPVAAPVSARRRKAEDSSESHEEDAMLEAGECSLNLSELRDTSNGINLIPFKGTGGVEGHPASSAQHVEITSVLSEREPKIPAAPKTGQTFWMNRKLTVLELFWQRKGNKFSWNILKLLPATPCQYFCASSCFPLLRAVKSFALLGTEWTAPGEFTKFSSQVSKPLRLMSSRRYYFELLHKQDDRGSDHVEVGSPWRKLLVCQRVQPQPCPADESSLKMNHVEHIPQTLASHSGSHLWEAQQDEHGADMLKPDPRDSFFLTPAIEVSHVENVLVPCAYSPTYVVKDFPIARYQGLQFVYLSFVYPNDFTRLTHMETENKCFYRESPLYLEKFGFYKYMKMDEEEEDPRQRAFLFLGPDNFLDDEEEEEEGVDSPEPTDPPPEAKEQSFGPAPRVKAKDPTLEDELGLPAASPKHGAALGLQPHLSMPIFGGKAKTPGPSKPAAPSEDEKPRKTQEKVYVTRLQPGKRKAPAQEPALPGIFLYPKPVKRVHLRSRTPQKHPLTPSKPQAIPGRRSPWLLSNISKERDRARRKSGRRWDRPPRQQVLPGLLALGTEGLFSHEDTTPAPGRTAATADYNSSEATRSEGTRVMSFLKVSETTASQQEEGKGQEEEEDEEEEVSDYSYEAGELQQGWLEDSINWQRTFSVSSVDFELLRSDWNDLRCNVSGNLQLGESEVVDVVAQYMERLNEKNGGIYTLLRIINVEKRRDTARGNRYLLELELAERGQRTVRLSEYVYVLLHQGKQDDSAEANPDRLALGATEPQPSAWSILYGKSVLCRPLRLSWRQDVMVHFVVPVKNQARWVQQFISDMAGLYRVTRDANFNIILVDFDSEDMDVEKALQDAQLPRFQYLRRTGNFERSAGLQAGVDMVEDEHSIVFLCDLHIHFPANILDSIRKHCVEGKLAYAPIVMRLSCGSSPREPNGYWEVNGFGLFGIYKSDFDRVGGMNTEEFRDRWGGEDWELLDRVLQSGLEVERLRLRNFYHYYHSKRGMWNARSKKPSKD
ncbi:B4GN4 acetylgalactosaminyltransferase, partial [Spelaeornis formosus]|nr:B4GN4 acetylgalactosaminyltransferase [Elachura formosa]